MWKKCSWFWSKICSKLHKNAKMAKYYLNKFDNAKKNAHLNQLSVVHYWTGILKLYEKHIHMINFFFKFWYPNFWYQSFLIPMFLIQKIFGTKLSPYRSFFIPIFLVPNFRVPNFLRTQVSVPKFLIPNFLVPNFLDAIESKYGYIFCRKRCLRVATSNYLFPDWVRVDST